MNLYLWMTFGVGASCLLALICLIVVLRSCKRWLQISAGICAVLMVATLTLEVTNMRISQKTFAAPVPDSLQIVFGGIKTLEDTSVFSLQGRSGKILWHHALGSGNADFTVNNGVVYANGCRSPDPTYGTCLSALRASDGSEMWHRVIDLPSVGMGGKPIILGASMSVQGSGGYNPSLSAPHRSYDAQIFDGRPFVMGDRLFLLVYGYLLALRTSDGLEMWHVALDRYSNDQVRAIRDGRVCLYDNHHLVALAATTGAPVWSVPMEDMEMVKSSGELLFLYAPNGAIRALHLSDGSLVWRTPSVNIGQIILADDEVITVTTNVDNQQTGTTVLRGRDGAVLWHSQEELVFTSPALSHSHLYISAGDRVSSLDAQNGRLIWQHRIADMLLVTIPVEIEGIVFLQARNVLHALRASDGVSLWQHRELEPVTGNMEFNRPVVINGVVFIATLVDTGSSGMPNLLPLLFRPFLCLFGCPVETAIMALRVSDGSVYWRYPEPDLVIKQTERPLQIIP